MTDVLADLRGLTLVQPMAAAIVHGTKRIENRPTDLPRAMRGVPTVVAVHAGKKWDEDYMKSVRAIDGARFVLTGERANPTYELQLRDEGIVGLMLLTGHVFTATDPPLCGGIGVGATCWYDRWWSGPFGYEIKHAVALEEPIRYRGMLGFWRVDVIAKTTAMRLAAERLLDEARAAT